MTPQSTADVSRAISDLICTLSNAAGATLEVGLNLPTRHTSDDVPTLAWFVPAYNDERKPCSCLR